MQLHTMLCHWRGEEKASSLKFGATEAADDCVDATVEVKALQSSSTPAFLHSPLAPAIPPNKIIIIIA